MKSRPRFLPLLLVLACVVAVSLPAMADNIYDNGQIIGRLGSWSISSGHTTSDSFGISDGDNKITGLDFGVWLTQGDVLESVELSITDQPTGGKSFFDQQVNLTQLSCFSNNQGFDVCEESATFDGPTLGNQEYWVHLTNAITRDGDPVSWDQNDGIGCQTVGCPSDAYFDGVGTIPSEAFTLLGTRLGGGTTPEPASLVLFASGLLGMAGFVRRTLR
jgi:hypothetical protein